ncbi:hypothetical protein WN944_029704 [Citrus x changshan-huyou]|uniref:Uncharacterized protein n=1 Tax=Citrus x changshan-huyou TaxID=2935761 RepID=A0AAP0LMB6_9ROSI
MMLCRDHSLAIINSYKELLILDLPELSKLKVNLNIGFIFTNKRIRGSDIRLLSKEAAMQPLRQLIVLLEGRQEVVPEDELPQLGPIRPEDVEIALKNTRPSAHLHAHRYEKLNVDYGSEILQ